MPLGTPNLEVIIRCDILDCSVKHLCEIPKGLLEVPKKDSPYPEQGKDCHYYWPVAKLRSGYEETAQESAFNPRTKHHRHKGGQWQ